METIYIILIAVVVTIAVYKGVKWLYGSIRHRLQRYFVHHKHFDECWKSTENKVLGLEKRHGEKIAKIEQRLVFVEKTAKNFDRDMESYHISLRRLMEVFKRSEETKKTITLVQFIKYANDNNILWYYNIPNYEDEEGNLHCNMPARIRKKLGIK